MDEQLDVEVEGVEAQVDSAAADATAQAAAESEARGALEAIRKATLESVAPKGIELDAAVRWLNEQLAAVTRERNEAKAEIDRLQPLADQGKQYREELVNQAVAEGVRAMGGEAFPEETYRAMLSGAPLEHIRQVRDTFAGQAAVRFPGGRQTRDEKQDEGKKLPETPAAAYGAE